MIRFPTQRIATVGFSHTAVIAVTIFGSSVVLLAVDENAIVTDTEDVVIAPGQRLQEVVEPVANLA
ncbi:hypothetical protein [Halovivax cerinus]|uniref:Uncharacterized protein n=1 Tax=Halovivax cerinus TaxID=1487865 RepID=A0ABD5NTC5_9EURY|nr:hypothetical protein [Halovivax cerinus]